MTARIVIEGDFPDAPAVPPGGWVMDDPILDYFGPDSGFAIDLSSAACFEPQANPVSGDVLTNFANKAETRNGAVTIISGVTFAGGGFYFGGVNTAGNFVGMPDAADAIQDDPDKSWFAAMTIKLPDLADWPATGGRTLCAFGNYSTGVDVFTVYLVNNAGTKSIVFRVQTATNVTTILDLASATNFAGKIVQIGGYRTASGKTQWRMKTLDKEYAFLSAGLTVAANSNNLDGLTWRYGALKAAQAASSFSDVATGGTWGVSDSGPCKNTLYRACVATMRNLTGGKSPLEILDEDLNVTAARGVFS